MGNSYKVQGTIIALGETKQVSEKFRKREFVVEVQDGKYAQTIPVEATGDRCDILNDYSEGDEVSVECNVRGRKWAGPNGTKYFLSLDAWKIERVGERRSTSAPVGGSAQDPIPF